MAGARVDRDSGFTLIELLIVVVILGVLAAVVVFAVGGITDRGTASAAGADEKTIEVAQEAHMAQFGTYTDEPGLVTAGLLRDESQLFDVELAGGGTNYTIGAAGAFLPPPTTAAPSPTTTAPPAGPVPVTYLGSYDGLSVGTGSNTLAIIGSGSGTGSLWSMLQATPPSNTQVVWLNASDVASSADVEAIFADADYVIASVSVAISTPSGPGYVGSYLNSAHPGQFWWTWDRGYNPSLATLESLLP
jgi:prepilin-type N-terminal cleavage/methylation domain-containing protein